MADKNLDGLVKHIQTGREQALPPVDSWHPELSGEIDIVIDKEGRWFHEGTAFQRERLVKLFASILKKEGEDYFLVSPVEKFRLTVEDLPFVATEMHVTGQGEERVCRFITNVGDEIVAGADCPIEVEYEEGCDEPSPRIKVRRNLYARIHRNVFYELVEMAEEQATDKGSQLVVSSGGERFVLGEY